MIAGKADLEKAAEFRMSLYSVGGRTLARRKGPTRTSLGYQASKQ